MSTHYPGNSKEKSALDTYIKLTRAAESLIARLNTNLNKEGVSEGQFGILDALFHLGPLNQRDLGKKLFKSGGNITMVVDNLEKKKYVKRERSKEDRRFFYIHITEDGKNLYRSIFPGVLETIVETTSVLNDKEKNELQRLCKLIGTSIS